MLWNNSENLASMNYLRQLLQNHKCKYALLFFFSFRKTNTFLFSQNTMWKFVGTILMETSWYNNVFCMTRQIFVKYFFLQKDFARQNLEDWFHDHSKILNHKSLWLLYHQVSLQNCKVKIELLWVTINTCKWQAIYWVWDCSEANQLSKVLLAKIADSEGALHNAY